MTDKEKERRETNRHAEERESDKQTEPASCKMMNDPPDPEDAVSALTYRSGNASLHRAAEQLTGSLEGVTCTFRRIATKGALHLELIQSLVRRGGVGWKLRDALGV